ncbi:MAG: preprotein translocase subunit SecE, partial [Clostridia bacterium]|nr:preprotein translocase subunit SecE [Clostridia bacterium]
AEKVKDSSSELALKEKSTKKEGQAKANNKDKKHEVKLNRKPASVASAAAKKSNKENLFKRFGKYVKSVFNELKKVHWPTRREVIIYTIVVVVAVLFMSVLLYVFDLLFGFIMKIIGLGK